MNAQTPAPAAERAGTVALPEDLVDLDALLAAYAERHPDPADPAQRVSFGTSGHRGSSLKTSFNEDHIAAITQAIVEYRAAQGITGPLLMGRDTHALSGPAQDTALEVLMGNGVRTLIDSRDGYTPTPAVSHAILVLNDYRTHGQDLADGIVITPSHNPPADGGFKYNPPHGGPADTDATDWIADRANELLAGGLAEVRRIPLAEARRHEALGTYDFRDRYVTDLPKVVDLDAIRRAKVRIGADPMGGASVEYWGEIAERHGLDLTVVNPDVDPQWAFMTLDWDGRIRMDCSSPNAMASLIGRMRPDAGSASGPGADADVPGPDAAAPFDIATGNDADADRHGIVTPDGGLMNPNHFLSVAIDYLYRHRYDWPAGAGVGKTLVSSSMIDRVAAGLDRDLVEVPVGFKWFVPGLLDGTGVFGGEESAGASFVCFDGTPWSTDKDGILLCLLAAEIRAVTGTSPSRYYADLVARYGDPVYARIDAPATAEQKAKLKRMSPADVTADTLAGERIIATMTEAPGNEAPIGGLKVTTQNAWFAARPSGTEDVYKIYAESFVSAEHLAQVQAEAKAIVDAVIA
ncbi:MULTISPECIES: phosphoglucomutase (alpha-D-glucose-1,6-bisphosphate-dependent) [Micrococcaceae]|uniref:phosphoglucomutase (alpha-D-glucose-1,6-bisphosphate-dependent) n=1 Tax=Micrococcaceae TaxID=1268 RepID=UPI00161AE7EB|nr:MULTISPECIES: phosphoglucomutase (alpha-D-glucose-1,6-bisphosphate-dependent) [Micrococcaceae]MBB5750917.1 phosphoglucomutase [Micrococcus sp. TA1]HRO30415.1 phosphoglucomutase (alpha-D-glucose-1,6-bisphosphate-dependent) [Citricoccus sp.]HRO92482.1 phosphoglucomutase (alpha-D-glucose-1,6-bisphosphate-dependent) [Citricoccus sp.]